MAFTPLGITVDESEAEVRSAWARSYSRASISRALRKIKHRPFGERATMFGSALAFRGIFFPQVRKRDWVVLLLQHSRTIVGLVVEGLWMSIKRKPKPKLPEPVQAPPVSVQLPVPPAPVEDREPVLSSEER